MPFNHQYDPKLTLFVRNINRVFPDGKSHYNDVKDEVQKQLGKDSVNNVFHESGKNYGYVELKQIEDKEILLKQKEIYVSEIECLIFSEYESRRYFPRSGRTTSLYEDGEVIDKSTSTETSRNIYSNHHDNVEQNQKRKRDRHYLSSQENISNKFEKTMPSNHRNHHSRHYQQQQQVAFIPFIVDPNNSMMYPQFPSMDFPIQQQHMALSNYCYENSFSQRYKSKKPKY